MARDDGLNLAEGSTGPFLGPQAFVPGTYTPKSTKATTGGRATYRGNIVATNLDRTLVEAILPPGLKVAQNRVAPGLHPVIYLYGRPEDTSWIIDNKPLMYGTNYKELMLLVPFVHEEAAGALWHNYVVRMYLNNGMAIWIGNEYFAYAKEFGTLQESAIDLWTHEVTAFDTEDTPTFRARSKRTGPWRPSDEADIPNYQEIQAILAMPVVGWRPSSKRFVCSYFELDYTHARVAPVESAHEFLHPFVPGMSPWVGLRLSNVVNGAVAVRDLEWRIDHPPPEQCRF